MASLIHPLRTLFASLTRQNRAKQLTYLRTENRFLRSKLPQRIELSNHERSQLVKHGKSLGPRTRELISVVSYSTFRRWVREMEATPKTGNRKKVARAGRPRDEDGVHDAIIRIPKETGWGYTKIAQAMRRLGHTISRQTVKMCWCEPAWVPNRKIIRSTWNSKPITWSPPVAGRLSKLAVELISNPESRVRPQQGQSSLSQISTWLARVNAIAKPSQTNQCSK